MPKKLVGITETDVVQALEESKGNQRAAAEKLRTSQGWLVRWLQRNNYRLVCKWEKVQS